MYLHIYSHCMFCIVVVVRKAVALVLLRRHQQRTLGKSGVLESLSLFRCLMAQEPVKAREVLHPSLHLARRACPPEVDDILLPRGSSHERRTGFGALLIHLHETSLSERLWGSRHQLSLSVSLRVWSAGSRGMFMRVSVWECFFFFRRFSHFYFLSGNVYVLFLLGSPTSVTWQALRKGKQPSPFAGFIAPSFYQQNNQCWQPVVCAVYSQKIKRALPQHETIPNSSIWPNVTSEPWPAQKREVSVFCAWLDNFWPKKKGGFHLLQEQKIAS